MATEKLPENFIVYMRTAIKNINKKDPKAIKIHQFFKNIKNLFIELLYLPRLSSFVF